MWLEETYFINIDSNNVLLIDLWIRHCPNIISDLTLAGKHITPSTGVFYIKILRFSGFLRV